jgi:hypothetical protein
MHALFAATRRAALVEADVFPAGAHIHCQGAQNRPAERGDDSAPS